MTKRVAATLATLTIACLAGCDKGASSDDATAKRAPVIGKRIEFKQGGDSEQYRVSGWSKTEEKFTWSEGTSAKLSLPIGSDAGPWSLRVTMAGLIKPPDLPTQPVEVYANDKKVVDWQVGNTAEFTATIPQDVNKAGGMLDVEFRMPKAISPKSLGQSEDTRILGICVSSLELTKA